MNTKKSRDPALDIIRCIALLCVVSVHFFLYSEFYNETVEGIDMLIMCTMRNGFMICVPLFLMLTGYLAQSKETNKSYYIKIIRIVYIYVLTSILCGLYETFVLKIFTVSSAILGIFSFETISYSWYIEMYLGLFLLIPFLNTLYDGLNIKKKQLLIVTMLLLTALPSILNIFDIYSIYKPDWWLMPSKSTRYTRLVPDAWICLYPITYFYLGKYFREHPIKLAPRQIAVLGIFVFLFAGIFNYYRPYGSTFIVGPWQDYNSFLVTVQAVLVFNFFIRIKYNKLSETGKRVFAKISDLSLGAYLTSLIFDSLVYFRLNNAVQTMLHKLIYFPVIVTLVLISSLICSYIIDLSYSLTVKRIIYRYINREIRS